MGESSVEMGKNDQLQAEWGEEPAAAVRKAELNLNTVRTAGWPLF